MKRVKSIMMENLAPNGKSVCQFCKICEKGGAGNWNIETTLWPIILKEFVLHATLQYLWKGLLVQNDIEEAHMLL